MNNDIPTLLREGIGLQRAGRLQEAEKNYRQVLAQKPDHPAALHLLGVLAGQAGKPAVGIDLIRRAISLHGDNAASLISLGALLQQSGQVREALESFERALSLQPDSYPARYQQAVLLHNLGEYDNAIAAYERARALQPANAELLVNLGAAYNASGEAHRAIGCYRDALALQPEMAAAHGNLGNALMSTGATDEAIAELQRCLELQPDHPTAHANLGSCYLQAGALESAQAAYAACLERTPGDVTSLAMLAAIHNEQGEDAQAAELLDYDRLLLTELLETPAGWDTQDAFHAALHAEVMAHPTLRFEPDSHTTRKGQQTGSLLEDPAPATAALIATLRQRLTHYLATIPAGPWDARRPAGPDAWRLDIWATVLHEGGHQSPHIHPSGWLSGVFYVACDSSADADDTSGWIEFGRSPETYPFQKPPRVKQLQPEPGLLVLFPSYFYHNTIPFHGSEPRISVAFDVVPRRPR